VTLTENRAFRSLPAQSQPAGVGPRNSHLWFSQGRPGEGEIVGVPPLQGWESQGRWDPKALPWAMEWLPPLGRKKGRQCPWGSVLAGPGGEAGPSGFFDFVAAAARVRAVQPKEIRALAGQIPPEWVNPASPPERITAYLIEARKNLPVLLNLVEHTLRRS